MTNDWIKPNLSERPRVNIHEPNERKDWADRFGVTTAELLDAVECAGDKASDVEAFLKRKKNTE